MFPGDYVTRLHRPNVSGTVCKVSADYVFIMDRRSGKRLSIPRHLCRMMTPEQTEAYCDAIPSPHLHPQEYIKRKLDLRSTWTPDEESERRVLQHA